MQIVEIDINKLKPDPDQPRKSIDEADLKEMAASIVTEGVINPIEVDSKYMIITGERRWRAARLAGKQTVPVKILSLDKDERFMRQVIENIHHNTMSDWDTANALNKLLTFTPGVKVRHAPQVGPTADKGITWLSRKTGKSHSYIEEKLSLLNASKSFQKSVRTGEIPGSFIRAVQRAPKEYKKAIEKKIINREFRTRDDATYLVSAILRTRNPHLVKDLLKTDYSKYKTRDSVVEAINKISPPPSVVINQVFDPVKDLGKIVDNLRDWIRHNPMEKIDKSLAPRIIVNLNFAKSVIDEWFGKGKADELLLEEADVIDQDE